MHFRNNALIISAIAVGLVAGPASIAFASPLETLETELEAGGVELGDREQGSSNFLSTAVERLSDGAYWEYGVGKKDTISDYFRERSSHGSTAVGKKSKRVTGVRGGLFSRAHTPRASSHNKAYYHNC